MVYKRSLLIALALGVGLAGCDVSEDEDTPASPNPNDASAVGFKAQYQPTVGIAPYPNDIYRGSDGTVAPPGAYDPASADDPDADFGNQNQAVSTLDGFSTVAPINVYFNDAVDASSLVAGQTVFAVKIADQGNQITPAPIAVELDLSPAEATGQSVVEITPSAPLDPLGTYAFIVTTQVESSTGSAAQASDVFQTIKDAIESGETLDDPTLEQIKNEAVAPVMQVAQGLGLSFDDVAVGWTVTTQSVGASLQAVEAMANAGGARDHGIAPVTNPETGSPFTTQAFGGSGKADLYAGIIEVPYYLDAQAPLSGFWTAPGGEFLNAPAGRVAPEPTGTIQVPMLITIPNSTSASGGAIVGSAIFQHGITQSRTNALAVADTLADTGRAVIAIDLPLHGITDTSSGLYADPGNPLYEAIINNFPVDGVTEAHFNLDVVNNSDGSEGSDGNIDSSGTHFINLRSLLTSGDNLRQGVANLMHLVETIPAMDYNTDGSTDFSGKPIDFVGHSLGGIVGSTFLAINQDVGAATLGMPGGNISNLLRNSPTFAPRINAGLEAQGVVAGTQLYRDFFRNAQTAIDTGDPINYGAAAAAGHNIHMLEVVGGSTSDPDQVVPNSATEALIGTMGLTCKDENSSLPTGPGFVRFLAGDHGSLLDPSASQNATAEMQSEMAVFISSGGDTIFDGGTTAPVDPTIIECP